jgi:hypothetical protein
MEIGERIVDYIHDPFPLWDEQIANLVIDYKWNTSLKNIFQNRDNYSITGCLLKDKTKKEEVFSLIRTRNKIKISFPSDKLNGFYTEHGLEPTDVNISFDKIVKKINNAIEIIGKIKPLQSFIFQLVKSVQIIESEDTYTDISYSHPDIPFSIFFSICEDNSIISDLRVAESILHESMHLYLTLIENIISIVEPTDNSVFYSPWRNEERPLRGVLHGLFVFRTILEFYSELAKRSFIAAAHEYILNRISEIKREINLIIAFPLSDGLTNEGQKLSSMLLL